MSDNKRPKDDNESDEEWVGPLPSEATPAKKQKGTRPNLNRSLCNVYLLLFIGFDENQ